MIFSRLLLIPLFAACLLLLPEAASAKAPVSAPAQAETTLEVKAKLDAFAREHTRKANLTLVPGRSSMSVKKENGLFVARFLEVDIDTMTTEIYSSNTPGCQYVGHIVYLEKTYECTGKNKVEAQQGDFKAVKARRIRELTRYDRGAWQY